MPEPEASPEAFSEGSGCISEYIPTQVIIQTLSITKNNTLVLSSLVVHYWKSLFSILL